MAPRIFFGLGALLSSAVLIALAAACDNGATTGPTPTAERASPSPTEAAESPSPTPTAPVTEGESAFSGADALEHVRALALEIGPRPAGEEGERRAAAYITAELERSGFAVASDPFTFSTFVDEGSSVEVLGTAGELIAGDALVGSAAGQVSGRLVPAGIGGPEEFPAQVAGNVALIQRGTLTFGQKVANAAAAGATAVVIYNNEPGGFMGTLGETATIPAVAVSRQAGEELAALVATRALTVRVEVRGGVQEVPSANVVGRGGGPCQVILGGHYDSVPVAPGANDNASGVATALEAAQTLAARGEAEGLCVVAFGAEELGLFGSQAFVEELAAEDQAALAAVINLDAVAVGSEWQVDGDARLAALAQEVAKRLRLRLRYLGLPAFASSDHASFLEAGIPAVILFRADDPLIHSPEDDLDRVSAGTLEEIGELVVALAEAISGEP